MKILSFQPFSLYENGGGGRVLRRLFEGHESDVTSLPLLSHTSTPQTGNINEVIIHAFPVNRKWMRWYLRHFFTYLREKTFKALNVTIIRRTVSSMVYDVLHIVHHGTYANALHNYSLLQKKTLWVSFHDHFSTSGASFIDTKSLWLNAQRRLIITKELGLEYQRLFGKKDFEVITDGIKHDEISLPNHNIEKPTIIYFAGLVHIAYIPLFQSFASALDSLFEQGYSFTLILRGTQILPFLKNRKFKTKYFPVSLNDLELKAELDNADILYLPINSDNPNFHLYSLSTKMVGYLGGRGAIFYHGSENSAAAKLLQDNQAAECCYSLEVSNVENSLKSLFANHYYLSNNAKTLAKERFSLVSIQDKFWYPEF